VERVSLKGILIFHTNSCLPRFLGFALFIVQIHARYYVGTLQTSFKVQTVADVCFRGCKVLLARSGGVTHWLVTPDDDGTPMTICWGQTANNGLFYGSSIEIWLITDSLGELGLGPEERKSCSKPTRNVPLVGIHIFE
jgi:hypothetical protein